MILRTDLNITQLPSTLPSFGGQLGKNIIQTDPDFGTRIVRVTDASDAVGRSMQTADSGAAGIWNKNDTMLLCRSTGGSSFLFQFRPGKMQATNLGRKFSDPTCFSRTQAGVLYTLLDNHLLQKLTFKLVNGVWTPTTAVTLCDFASVLPTGFKIKWTGSFIVALDDSTFMVGFSEGVQNTAFMCVLWRKGKGFRVLNTQTGQITGDWGQLGQGVVQSSTASFPFLMHECSMTPNPAFGNVGVSAATGSGHLIWELGTLNLRDTETSGHAAKGYLHYYAGGPGGGQIREVQYIDPSQTQMVVPKSSLPAGQIPPQKYDGDQHFGFGKVDTLDVSIFWISSQSQVYPFTACWMNEVRGMESQTGVVHRACHTFNSGLSSEFIVQHAIAVPSQTGKFVAFTSDMMLTLGGRGDVFVVETGLTT